jgi:hypothetical protein
MTLYKTLFISRLMKKSWLTYFSNKNSKVIDNQIFKYKTVKK